MNTLMKSLLEEKQTLSTRMKAVDHLLSVLSPTSQHVPAAVEGLTRRRITRKVKFRASPKVVDARKETIRSFLNLHTTANTRSVYGAIRKAGFKMTRGALGTMLNRMGDVVRDVSTGQWKLNSDAGFPSNTTKTLHQESMAQVVRKYVDTLYPNSAFTVQTVVEGCGLDPVKGPVSVYNVLSFLHRSKKITRVERGMYKKSA